MLQDYINAMKTLDTVKRQGRVIAVQGGLIESLGPQAVIGELCRVQDGHGRYVPAEVVAITGDTVQLMAYEEVQGVQTGCTVIATGETLSVSVGQGLLGRTLNSLGQPLDGKSLAVKGERRSVFQPPPHPLDRQSIRSQVVTGIRAIDGLVPLGEGQRVGVFSGSGVGKSTLLGMIARNTSADVNVIALIGERGREVREFIEHDLGEEGLKRSVLVVSTGDTSPLSRVRGAFTATTIAEYFRDQGKKVLLLFDSVTRFAMGQREIGLTIGEPPATRGYTPSVFSLLPKLLERSGAGPKGSITGIYTILVEGGDMDEPITDAVRGILDGHILLSRKLAEQYHYPAVDVLGSVSRLEDKILAGPMQKRVGRIRRLLALYREKEDLIAIGAYAQGSHPEVDEAIEKIEVINTFLRQGVDEASPLKDTQRTLALINGEEVEEDKEDEGLSL